MTCVKCRERYTRKRQHDDGGASEGGGAGGRPKAEQLSMATGGLVAQQTVSQETNDAIRRFVALCGENPTVNASTKFALLALLGRGLAPVNAKPVAATTLQPLWDEPIVWHGAGAGTESALFSSVDPFVTDILQDMSQEVLFSNSQTRESDRAPLEDNIGTVAKVLGAMMKPDTVATTTSVPFILDIPYGNACKVHQGIPALMVAWKMQLSKCWVWADRICFNVTPQGSFVDLHEDPKHFGALLHMVRMISAGVRYRNMHVEYIHHNTTT